MKIAIKTFGCKLNQAEGQEIIKKLLQRDYQIVSPKEKADYYLINACAVTAKAEKEVRQLINQIERREPKSFLIVTGCYLPRENNKVDLWIRKNKLISKISNLRNLRTKSTKSTKPTKFTKSTNLTRTRSFIKIQDGCDKFCTYCLVPYLRGKPKSKSVKEIIQKIKEKERAGFQEIVLVGVNIGLYRNRKENIIGLIKKILEQTAIPRIRLSSLWPTTLSSELIDLFQNPRLCPHLHLSIQSGSNRILRLMGRNYIKQDIEKIIKRARRKILNLNLTADIIVGFPGETKKDFRATYNFLKAIGFLKIHIFKYSARPLTAASCFPFQIPLLIKTERSKKLIKLVGQLNKKTRQKFIGHQLPVLFEQRKKNHWIGLTNNYLKVYTKSRENIQNQIHWVELKKVFKDGVLGILVNF